MQGETRGMHACTDSSSPSPSLYASPPTIRRQASFHTGGGRGRIPELERRLQEVHTQYARRIKTLEARVAAAEAASRGVGAAAAQAAPAPTAEAAAEEQRADARPEADVSASRRQSERDDGARGSDSRGSKRSKSEAAAVEGAQGSSPVQQQQQQQQDAATRELQQQLSQRNRQVAELQQELRVAERQVRQLQRQQQQAASPAAAASALVQSKKQQQQQQQSQNQNPKPRSDQDCSERQRLQADLAAAQGALVLLQQSHGELLQRCAELGAEQQRAAVELREEVAGREAARWMERIERLEQVGWVCLFGGRAVSAGVREGGRALVSTYWCKPLNSRNPPLPI